ncbi:arabinosyltransferase domain-containing protein [Actinomycetospora sp. CA-101289]|uniref:arabinosyltransferase domain-containing protein n=1 Tax=Actinomycetospora sp. CA-101289 TaxID=3239893 RepID=UPI003D96E4DF
MARVAVALAALLAGLAAVLVAGLVAVAPVESSTSTVTWPRAGGDPTPTTLFLVPYRPAALTVSVPCAAIRGALDRGGRTTLIATSTSGGADGLVVRAEDGQLQVLATGRSVRPDVPGGDCGLTVTADGAGLTVASGAASPSVFPGDPTPEVFAVTTDLTGPDAAGLSLRARTPAWFDNASTPEKSALITLQLQLATVALGLLVVFGVLITAGAEHAPSGVRLADAMSRLPRRPADALRRIAVLAIDAVVATVLGWWSLVGPVTDDDGFATVIARQSLGGDVGNYYRWYDASEAPFASSQRVLQWFLDDGLSPVALRTPSVLACFALWLVVTRGVLRPVLGPLADRVGVRLLAALGLAVWWLPYDLGTRPESLVALGTTSVLALVLRAVRHRTGPSARPAVMLAVAAGVAALTTTVAPSGIVGAAPFLLCAPRVWQVLRHGGAGVEDRASRAEAALFLLARIAVPLGLAAVAVTVVFAQQSWHGVLVSTTVHDQIGPSQPWYAEWLRYTYLFGQDNWGTATKRLPVLLGLVLALPALVLLARRGLRTTGPSVLLALLPAGFVLLAVTPSKWSHHFGALAGFGAVATVVVVVGLVAEARRADARLGVVGAVTTAGLVLAAAAAFSGRGRGGATPTSACRRPPGPSARSTIRSCGPASRPSSPWCCCSWPAEPVGRRPCPP